MSLVHPLSPRPFETLRFPPLLAQLYFPASSSRSSCPVISSFNLFNTIALQCKTPVHFAAGYPMGRHLKGRTLLEEGCGTSSNLMKSPNGWVFWAAQAPDFRTLSRKSPQKERGATKEGVEPPTGQKRPCMAWHSRRGHPALQSSRWQRRRRLGMSVSTAAVVSFPYPL